MRGRDLEHPNVRGPLSRRGFLVLTEVSAQSFSFFFCGSLFFFHDHWIGEENNNCPRNNQDEEINHEETVENCISQKVINCETVLSRFLINACGLAKSLNHLADMRIITDKWATWQI